MAWDGHSLITVMEKTDPAWGKLIYCQSNQSRLMRKYNQNIQMPSLPCGIFLDPALLLIFPASKVNCFMNHILLLFPTALSISPLLSPFLDVLTQRCYQVLLGAAWPWLCQTQAASHRNHLSSPLVTKALPNKHNIVEHCQVIWGRKLPCFIPCYF